MVRVLQASKEILKYLESFDTSTSLTIGLILGQTFGDKGCIVHLAKTSIVPPLKLKDLSDINALWLADHAKQATRMLSGGMFVIGLFLVSSTDKLASFPIELKAVINQWVQSLASEYAFENSDINETVILNYSSQSKSIKCKSFNTKTSSVKPIELKLLDNITRFLKLECRYELDEHYYLEESHEVDLKKQISIILADVHNNLKSSVIIFDGELKNEDEILDSLGKRKKSLGSGRLSYVDSESDNKEISVTILQSCNEKKLSDVSIKTTNNQIKIVGQIASMVWLSPLASFKMASDALIQDIMRSLSTRLEMHCDSLIEEEHKEDSNSIHEPPRRVMIHLPNSEVTVSDYLFPGEGAQEAKSSVEEILDIKLRGEPDEIDDIEGSIDIMSYGHNLSQIVDGRIGKDLKEPNRMLFVYGSIFALVILIASILVHFSLN